MDDLHRTEQFRWLARLGYGARGTVYGIVGVLTLLGGSAAPDRRDALRTLLDAPFGRLLLAVVALGLVGYSAWRVVQSLKDVDSHGTSVTGLAIRGGLLVSGVFYTTLAFFTARLALGFGPRPSENEDWTATLMAQPAGRWLVGAVGLAVIGAGLAQLVKGWKRRYRRYIEASETQMKWIDVVSRYGLFARGAVFLIIGGFTVLAAYHSDASEARGLAGALSALQNQPYGPWLVMIVALGLVAFAVYSFVEAVFRRLSRPDRSRDT